MDEQDTQENNGIFIDARLSMDVGVADGIRAEELDAIVARPGVQKIQAELEGTFSRRDEPEHGFETDIGVINSPFDAALRERIGETQADIAAAGIDVKHVVLAGIGGSELGATAVITACGRKDIQYHPITSLNNDHIGTILSTIDPATTVLVEVSRSGTTKETLTAYRIIQDHLESRLGQAYKAHCVAILGTDKQEAAREAAGHYKISIEPAMSGRFSGLHAANMFTMAMMGVDIGAVHAGARYMAERCMGARAAEDNPALHVAALKYLMNTTRDKTVWNTEVFSPALVKYGDWLDQLTEESLGHNPDVRVSTKTVELSNKLHSDFQNWWAGANTAYHQVVFPLASSRAVIRNPAHPGETVEDIELAAYIGTVEALAANGRPSFTTFMRSVNPAAMGQLMMRDMLSTIYLGELCGLREEPGSKGKGYFNQPGVEAYKVIMKGLLADPAQLQERRAGIMAMQR